MARSTYSPSALSALWAAALMLSFLAGTDHIAQAYYIATDETGTYEEMEGWCAQHAQENNVAEGGFLASIPSQDFQDELVRITKEQITPETEAVWPRARAECYLDPTNSNEQVCYYINPCMQALGTGEDMQCLIPGAQRFSYPTENGWVHQCFPGYETVAATESELLANFTAKRWRAFIGLRVASNEEYEEGNVLWSWKDGVPYQFSDWFAHEPDHVNAQYGLDPDLIGVGFSVYQTTRDTRPGGNPSQTRCEVNAEGKLQPFISETEWWGDINIQGEGTPDSEGLKEWNIAGLCKIGRFDKRNCTAAERHESGCHVRASCEYDFVDYYCTCPESWTTRNGGFGERGCTPPPVPCDEAEGEDLCPSENQGCWKSYNFVSDTYDNFVCCVGGYEGVCSAPACTEGESTDCHYLASCDRSLGVGNPTCTCPEGAYGTGLGAATAGAPDAGCDTTSWAVRLTVSVGWITPESLYYDDTANSSESESGRRFLRTPTKLKEWYDDVDLDYRGKFARIYYGLEDRATLAGAVPDHFLTSMHHFVHRNPDTGEYYVTVNAFFREEGAAIAASERMAGRLETDDTEVLGVLINQRLLYNNHPLPNNKLIWGPRVYTWTLGTTADELRRNPTGLSVDSIYFKPDCLDAGCWVFDVTYAVGEENWNVWYIPRSGNNDDQSYDTDYSGSTLASTFLPINFPCQSSNYDPDNHPGYTPDTVSACCIPPFLADYRASADFEWNSASQQHADLLTRCGGPGDHDPPIVRIDACPLDNPSCWNMPSPALSGKFDGMPLSYVESLGAVDPYVGNYKARFFMDEVEMRQQAAMLTGTVGVEYTVRTFVGLAEFKPTGTKVIDMATRQVDIYLEKTSFFSVSTHGVNDYTFLQYVNLRLVEVLNEDADNTDEAANLAFDRTDDSVKAQYVQVTFTMGEQYGVKNNGLDLIPLDSVRIRKGTFVNENEMHHACLDFAKEIPRDGVKSTDELELAFKDTKDEFVRMAGQTCGPQASMCRNPTSVPDSFVSFNIPLGLNFLPQPEGDLSRNIFVSMVVQVQDNTADIEEDGEPEIMKTTLNAAIPVVDGGINIFCDGITAKTDLKEIAKVVIVIGSAGSESEISRLRILGEDSDSGPGALADSVLDGTDSTRVDTASIENALMTVVVLGDANVFDRTLENGQAPEASSWGLEMEDAITIHIMESAQYAGFDVEGSKAAKVLELINAPGEELFDSNNNLRTDGYLLNGAFEMEILRAENRARVHPSQALLQHCGFSATRPASVGTMPQTCIIRRDVAGKNTYPLQIGRDFATAIELPSCGGPRGSCLYDDLLLPTTAPAGGGGELDDREEFMASIFGNSDLARGLGRNFSHVIANRYQLDDRFKRAWWINPGYEWTPTQTAGAPIFQVSQKLLFFALFTLNENRAVGGRRRRVLLQAQTAENSGLSSLSLSFDMNAAKLLAQGSGVDEEQVKPMVVEMRLTQEQLCDLEENQLREDLTKKIARYIEKAARDSVKAISISNVNIDRNGASCPSRRAGGRGSRVPASERLRAAQSGSFTDAVATVETLVAFKTDKTSLDKAAFEDNEDVLAISSDDIDWERPTSTIPPDDDGDDSGGSNLGIIVGVVVGVVALIALAGAYLMYSRRQQQEEVSAVSVVREASGFGDKPLSMWSPDSKPFMEGSSFQDNKANEQLLDELGANMAVNRISGQQSQASAAFGGELSALDDFEGPGASDPDLASGLARELQLAHAARRTTGESKEGLLGKDSNTPAVF